jgi:thioredoxin-like negative regulator of GroEL
MSAASRLDPLYLNPHQRRGLRQLFRRSSEALSLLNQALELEPESPIALMTLASPLVQSARTQEAPALLARLEPVVAAGRLSPEGFQAARDLVLADTGDATQWRPAMDRLLAWKEGEYYEIKEQLAMILARRGEIDAALAALAHEPAEVPPLDWLMLCPTLEPLRGDNRFDRLASEARPRFEEMLRILAGARSRGEFPAHLEKSLADLRADLGMPRQR